MRQDGGVEQPHAPHLRYLCDDPECCDNGCPVVTCRSCGEDWPCLDWRSRHNADQVRAQIKQRNCKIEPLDDGGFASTYLREIAGWRPKRRTASGGAS